MQQLEIAEPELHFGDHVTHMKKSVITEHYAKSGTPARLNLKLFPHQETAVQALLDLEDRRVFTSKTTFVKDSSVVIVTSSAVLSEPVGSGKTYIILGVIAHRQIPKAMPLIANSILLSGADDKSSRFRTTRHDPPEPMHDITVRFNGPRALIKPNLVVVGSSVLVQWENAVRQNTNFRVLTIGDFHGMNQFKRFLEKNDLNQFQIILMKNGTVTGNLNIGTDGNKTYMSMIYAMAEITRDYCWSRVFYDDFDTIKIPPGSCTINSLFNVYVSATEKKDVVPFKKDRIEYNTLAEMFEAKTPIALANVLQDQTLFTTFNVKNDPAFTERSTRITLLEQYRYVYDNPDDNFIRVMGALGDDEAKETIEALNAGAYGHAAQKWGCESKSVGDIFKRMLDKQYDRYMVNVYILDAIEKTRTLVADLPEYPEDKKYKAKVLDQIRGAVIKKTVPAVKYFDERIITALDELHLEYTQLKERDGIAIQRVIDNVKQGDCQVCCLPLEGFDVFIVRCCGLIVCDTCGIKGNQIALRYNYKVRGNVICGKCANCKADVFPQTDLIYVDHKFDMSGLIQAKGDEAPLAAVEQEIAPPVEEIPDGEKEPEIKNPKLKALYKIVKGENIPEREKVNNEIKNLLKGSVDIPQNAKTQKKVLLFAGFDESLNMIEEFCVERKIEYLRLCGNARQMAKTVKKFKTYGTIMLINSQQYCAGLNLEFSTDLVFFHKILNENVEGQVAGRIQRIGRTVNGRIHYLCYRNEKNM
jgi:SNF2 family DNA or RNA helicase